MESVDGSQVEIDEDHHETMPVARKRSSKDMKRVDSLMAEVIQFTSAGHYGDQKLPWGITLRLAFQTIGVIYGDLGTSPLYVYDTTFADAYYGQQPSKNDILGALSIIIYTFTLVPLIKYIFIVLKANDRGNGGTFALFSLICRHARVSVSSNEHPEDHELSAYHLDLPNKNVERSLRLKEILKGSKFFQSVLLIMALLGTCAVIGDGVLTPSISVLSAIQGLKVNSPSISQHLVVGVSCAILIVLFSVQRFGTDKVGYTFAPWVVVWFISISLIGFYNIAKYDVSSLKAFNPYYIYDFFLRNKKQAWSSLGGIVLCITGTEAMFADLGHFSVLSVQIAFTTLVYPCLLLAYVGQASFLLQNPGAIGATFYKSIPSPVYWPMFVVATGAAIIASQAMISATFSIVDQSMALSCFPRVKVTHTSKQYVGQIYIPEMNWLLMILCVAVTAGFGSGTQIGNAYGVAVVAVMLVTTNLLTLIIVMVFQRHILLALLFWSVFSAVELLYFSSVMFKVPQGGWIPLAFAGVFFTVMYTWHYGRQKKYDFEVESKLSMDYVVGLGSDLGVVRVPGIGLVYTELAQGVPNIFSHLINNLPAVHSILVFVCIKYLPVPSIPGNERFLVRRLGPQKYRMYRCAVRFGYNDGKREDDDFENLLIDCLTRFIVLEDDQVRLSDESLDNGHHMPSPARSVLMGNNVNIPAVPIASEVGPEMAGVDEELMILRRARQTGLVYLLGRTETRAKKESSIFRKFVIDSLYDFLRRNSRDSALALGIPHTKLLQVGMVYSI